MRLFVWLARALVLGAALATLAACAGTAHMATGAVPQRLPNGATIRVSIPKPRASARGAQYVSPATTQMTIDIEQGGVAIAGYPQTIGLTPTSTGCTSTLANTLCQLSLALAPGSYSATVTLLDSSNNALSSAQGIPFTVVAGTNNVIPLVLGGIPHAIDLTPVNAPNTLGPSGLEVLGMQPIPIAAYATDADDNIIVGPGAPSISASVSSVSSGSGIIVNSPSSTAPNTLTFSSSGFGTATLSVVATPSIGSAIQTQLPVTTGYYVTLIAGGGLCGFVDGTGTSALFGCQNSKEIGLADDVGDGDLYAADEGNCAIRQITTAGVVNTLAGAGPYACGFADGTGSAATFAFPKGIAYDPANGDLYVTATYSCAIRQVTTAGVVTTLAGAKPTSCGFTDGAGSAARFSDPQGIAYDAANGDLYVADYNNCAIRQVTTAGGVTTIAGAGPYGCGFADGTGSTAKFYNPDGIAYDPANGDLYVADAFNCAIRQITTAGIVTTIAGAGPYGCGFADGTGSTAKFYHPEGIAYDPANGDLYVADVTNGAIRQLTITGVVTTIDRNLGNFSFSTAGLFNGPTPAGPMGVTVNPTNGTLYVTGNSRIVSLQL